MSRKLNVFIAMSLDGYIATTDDDIGFLSAVEREGEDYGYSRFMELTDTVIVGRRTYDKVRSLGVDVPYAGKQLFVVTRTPGPVRNGLHYFSGDLRALVNELKSAGGANICCDGGAEVMGQLLNAQLVDEMTISVIPVLLGGGIALFRDLHSEQTLELISSTQFASGLVQLHYRCAANSSNPDTL